MYTVLMIIHVLISASLVIVILTQSSKGGALDGMLGGVATNALGGQSASSFLKNATKVLAFLFMVSCVLLAFQLKSNKVIHKSKALEKVKSETVKEEPNAEEVPILPSVEGEPKETPAGN